MIGPILDCMLARGGVLSVTPQSLSGLGFEFAICFQIPTLLLWFCGLHCCYWGLGVDARLNCCNGAQIEIVQELLGVHLWVLKKFPQVVEVFANNCGDHSKFGFQIQC